MCWFNIWTLSNYFKIRFELLSTIMPPKIYFLLLESIWKNLQNCVNLLQYVANKEIDYFMRIVKNMWDHSNTMLQSLFPNFSLFVTTESSNVIEIQFGMNLVVWNLHVLNTQHVQVNMEIACMRNTQKRGNENPICSYEGEKAMQSAQLSKFKRCQCFMTRWDLTH